MRPLSFRGSAATAGIFARLSFRAPLQGEESHLTQSVLQDSFGAPPLRMTETAGQYDRFEPSRARRTAAQHTHCHSEEAQRPRESPPAKPSALKDSFGAPPLRMTPHHCHSEEAQRPRESLPACHSEPLYRAKNPTLRSPPYKILSGLRPSE